MSTTPLVKQLTLDEAQRLTERIKETVETVWEMLLVAHEGKVWIPLGYSDWKEYVTSKFEMSERHSYRLLDQAAVINSLAEATDQLVSPHLNEYQARRIKPQLPSVVEAVKEAVAEGMEPAKAVDPHKLGCYADRVPLSNKKVYGRDYKPES